MICSMFIRSRNGGPHHIRRTVASFGTCTRTTSTSTACAQINTPSKACIHAASIIPSSLLAFTTPSSSSSSHILKSRFSHTSVNNEVPSSSTAAIAAMTGEECYNRSIEYLKKHKIYKRQLEEKNANEQYEAMMKMSTQNNNNNNNSTPTKQNKTQERIQNRQANIAVVQTIVKQTRDEQRINLNYTLNQSMNLKEEKKEEKEEDFEKKAIEYMQYAAFTHGHPKALVQLGNEALELAKRNTTFSGNGEKSLSLKNPYIYIVPLMKVTIDIHRIIQNNNCFVDVAKILYQEAIDRGNNKAAIYNLAHLLWTESEDDEVEENGNRKKLESIRLFQRAAIELNDIDASYFLGVQHITLFGTIPDDGIVNDNAPHASIVQNVMDQNNVTSALQLRQVGFEMIEKASAGNHGGASYYLSLLHRNGDKGLGIQPSTSKFQQYLDLACDDAVMDPDALYLRAHCIYHKEDGYDKTISSGSHYLKDALRDFIKSGEAGNPDGYISAGAMLHHGHGKIIEQDRRKAFELYQEAAEMGSKEGWRNVVACYALGQGVPQCEETAKYITKTMLNDEDDN